MSRKSVTILGVKIPVENTRWTVDEIAGWISYRYLYTVTKPPERKTWVEVAPTPSSKDGLSSSGTYSTIAGEGLYYV
jgi:hypothetical protein